MTFQKSEVADLLARCHRRCCVCHRFCGVKIEIHHVEPRSKGGNDTIENGIPLCFECHAEVNHYNDAHPRGRKFTAEELLSHKNQWLEVCLKHPSALISAPRDTDIGPLEGMSLELEHNEAVVMQIAGGSNWREIIGSVLLDNEYKRSIAQGSHLLLPESLRKKINSAYTQVGRINTFVMLYSNTRPEGNAFAEATNRLLDSYRKSSPIISSTKVILDEFLLQQGGESQ